MSRVWAQEELTVNFLVEVWLQSALCSARNTVQEVLEIWVLDREKKARRLQQCTSYRHASEGLKDSKEQWQIAEVVDQKHM